MTKGIVAGRRIVVGVDASPAAGAALRWAIEDARRLGGEVIAVHAFEAPVFFAYPYGDSLQDTLDAALREGVRRCFEEDWCS